MNVTALPYLVAHIRVLRRELARHRDAGYSTETIAVAALLVVLALAVIGILATAVTNKAKSIDLDGGTGT